MNILPRPTAWRAYRLTACLLIVSLAASAEAILPRRAPAKPAPEATKPVPVDEKPTETKPAAAEAGPVPQVEVYVPSITQLGNMAARSKSAAIARGLMPLVAPPESTLSDTEGFDFAGLLAIVDQIRTWPDTSLSLALYTQDADGRPRWALEVDWPPADVAARLRAILAQESAKKLLENVTLTERPDKSYALELPDTLLAIVSPTENGTRIASAESVKLPDKLWGVPSAKNKRAKSSLYCRLNLAESGEGETSTFGQLSGIRDLKYSSRLRPDGNWEEQFTLAWNPLIGLAVKSAAKRVRQQYDCPAGAYANLVANIDMNGALADMLASLPAGTIGRRAGGEFAVSVMPGSGFLPIPEMFYEFRLSGRDRAIEAIRKHIADEAARRAEDDDPPDWHESTVGGEPLFWHSPTGYGAGGLSPATYRTVIFFERLTDAEKAALEKKPATTTVADKSDSDKDDAKEEKPETVRLVIVSWTGFPDDAPAAWRKLRSSRAGRESLPQGDAHWQARVNWKRIYQQAEPYLNLLGSVAEDPHTVPSADELSDSLVPSLISLQFTPAGAVAKHVGPIPVGAAYVPAVTAMAIASQSDASSESQREQTAAQNLRTLYHHAKLFRKDYGRWPATVAELDGYIDFASHPELLWLPPPKRGFIAGLASIAVGGSGPRLLVEDDRIDDSRYEIECDETSWRLKLRAGELTEWETILVDQDGKIHRRPKKGANSPAEKPEKKNDEPLAARPAKD